MADSKEHRAMLERLASMSSFAVHSVTAEGESAPWWDVDVRVLIEDLMVHETDLAHDVKTISVQIMHWGRMEAQTRRVWEIAERAYRVWQAQMVVAMTTPPLGDKNWKKPTEHVIEASYRSHKQYAVLQRAVERAEEAHHCARFAREAFVAKRDMLRQAVMRAYDNSAPRLAV